LRPLPFDEPQRVLTLRVTRQSEAAGGTGAEFLALRDQTHAVFDHVAARVETGFSIRIGDTPVLVSGSRVSADYFRVFGVEPAIGRSFTAEEDVPGRDDRPRRSAAAIVSGTVYAQHLATMSRAKDRYHQSLEDCQEQIREQKTQAERKKHSEERELPSDTPVVPVKNPPDVQATAPGPRYGDQR
jgi:hypothetical protein